MCTITLTKYTDNVLESERENIMKILKWNKIE